MIVGCGVKAAHEDLTLVDRDRYLASLPKGVDTTLEHA